MAANSPVSDSAVGNIKHVIVLMFENRSFDHVLGDMPGVNGVHAINGAPNPEIYNLPDPTQPPSGSNPPVTPMEIVTGAGPATVNGQPVNYEAAEITYNYDHSFAGMMSDLYGAGTNGVVNGQPTPTPAKMFPGTNPGFYQHAQDTASVLSYFAWYSMQVFHPLADNFVVCDAWYCDYPGYTLANRAFMHCATIGSQGLNDPNFEMVNSLSIFEQLERINQTWKMYWSGDNCDTVWLNDTVQQQLWNSQEPGGFNVSEVPIAQLFVDLKSDPENSTLPFYSFIMCWNSIGTDTSMHPDSSVEAGENLLACIYNALRASPYWENTLLVVTFDENGGIYDHMPVLPATPPVAGRKPQTEGPYTFDFTVLGPRIPVLLISPWLQRGVCSTQFQNTSILRFLQDLGVGALLSSPPAGPFLTQRDKTAPSITSVFDYSGFGLPTVRDPSSYPASVAPYQESSRYPNVLTCAQFQGDWTPSHVEGPPAPHMVKTMKEYLQGLPGHADSGKAITRDFATVSELRAYYAERRDASIAWFAAQRKS